MPTESETQPARQRLVCAQADAHRREWTTQPIDGFRCPSCLGVLVLHRVDNELSLTCRNGHRLSADKFVDAKEEQFEAHLRSWVELYGELGVIHRELAAVARAEGAEAVAEARDGRAARVDGCVLRLRAMIASDCVVPEAARA